MAAFSLHVYNVSSFMLFVGCLTAHVASLLGAFLGRSTMYIRTHCDNWPEGGRRSYTKGCHQVGLHVQPACSLHRAVCWSTGVRAKSCTNPCGCVKALMSCVL
jgi:hypothetical protein